MFWWGRGFDFVNMWGWDVGIGWRRGGVAEEMRWEAFDDKMMG